MHEKALMNDIVRRLEALAEAEHARRVTAIGVRVGALSHFTPEHFREHFADAARGTVAEGACVRVTESLDLRDRDAQGVVLETVEVEAA